jgi:gamma-glutamyltranspeptidase / glutathione hydrolase
MRRREFMGTMATGVALASTGGLAGCVTNPKGSGVQATHGGILSDSKRKQLVGLADFGRKQPVAGKKGVAVSTHPLVTQAALDVISDGGNAVDAIVSASITQSVVEPHMTTLTGVWSMLYYEAKTGKVRYLNCSNNAPSHLPVTQDEWNKGGIEMLNDGRGVTVPGFWAGIEEALRVYGTLPKKRLCAPAIDYARNGFEIHSFLWAEMFAEMGHLCRTKAGREMFMPNGTNIPQVGEKLYQKRAADLLERLVDEGNDYFYHGGFAEKFSTLVQEHGGWVSPDDFAAYKPRWDDVAQSKYREFDYYGAPWPDFGGQLLGEIFNVLSLLDLEKMGPASQSGETLLTMRRVIDLVAEQNMEWDYRKKARPNIERIMSLELAQERLDFLRKQGLSGMAHAMETVAPPPPGSNHLTVTDAQGNVATVLHSCMSWPWSNGLFVDGINICAAAAHYFQGLPGPGERIRARIGPNLFMKNGKPVLVSGSPSVSLVENIVQTSTSILDFGMDIEQAVHQPRFGSAFGSKVAGAFHIESTMQPSVKDYLSKNKVKFQLLNPWTWSSGSFEGIYFDQSGLAHACGDPRRTAQAFAL